MRTALVALVFAQCTMAFLPRPLHTAAPRLATLNAEKSVRELQLEAKELQLEVCHAFRRAAPRVDRARVPDRRRAHRALALFGRPRYASTYHGTGSADEDGGKDGGARAGTGGNAQDPRREPEPGRGLQGCARGE